MALPAPDVARILAPLDAGDLRSGLCAAMANIVDYFREVLPVAPPSSCSPDVGLEGFC